MPNNIKSFNQLRIQFPAFYYQSFSYQINGQGFEMNFRFQMGEHIFFEPSLKWPEREFYHWNLYSKDQLDLLVFHCGLIELISYWKAACPPKVIIQCAQLNPTQIQWWKKLYFSGLGEFFYLNDIHTSVEQFMTIECNISAPNLKTTRFILKDAVLIPVGGGKDSVVTLELLKPYSKECRPLIINPRGASLACAKVAGFDKDQIVEIQRRIDPKLLELNAQGFLNGHTPFSAMLAFTSLLAAVATGYRYIALSNENSANEPTIDGSDINHQYSKSFEFESDFRTYVNDFISPDIQYFSFLRPLSELAIAELFAKQNAYHTVFKSCNAGSKDDIWCGNCPKCLFAFIILSPFIEPQLLQRLFGRDLLDDIHLKPYLDQLCGIEPVKPFECVGTTAEVNIALQMRLKRFPQDLNALLRYYIQTPCYNVYPKHSYCNFDAEHALEQKFVKYHPFSEDFSVGIIGMGREGHSTLKYLRKNYPEAHLLLSDQSNEFTKHIEIEPSVKVRCGDEYLTAVNNQSAFFISPGISLKDHPEIEKMANLNSQTNEFLRRWAQNVIAVTGTKGKSTTSTLIYHLIKSHTDNVLLLGNMGFPMLDAVDTIGLDTLVVCELSSHQLQHIRRSPHIAVLLNLYEEHLDHYRSFEDYQRAKWQITRFQNEDDTFIYNVSDPRIEHWINTQPSRAHAVPVSLSEQPSSKCYIDGDKVIIDDHLWGLKSEISILPGEHNLFNVICAIRVATMIGIPDTTIKKALLTFKALPHRLQDVGTFKGIRFINDSISTIPEATIAALKSFDKIDTLILGGFDRGISYAPLYYFLQLHPVNTLLFVGQAGARMLKEMSSEAYVNGFYCEDYASVVRQAFILTPKGGMCLLSPAASSYDQFKNFEERGSRFVEWIRLE